MSTYQLYPAIARKKINNIPNIYMSKHYGVMRELRAIRARQVSFTSIYDKTN
jgi:uroporphyrinogen-III decarboxylase